MEKEGLENKVKFDWLEMIPAAGLAEFFIRNFDNAEKRDYTGFGGQFAKHLKQIRESKIANSIPIDTMTYGFYQAYSIANLYMWFK